MISEKDDDLLGVSNSIDGMGVLAVWTTRARDLIPHLTAQTTNVRGFQILIEAFRLWEDYLPAHPEHHDRLDDFFVLVEQAFARTVTRFDDDWPLPGARRVRAQIKNDPHISLRDQEWHLLGSQKSNGLWGLYRRAAGRATLLDETGLRLLPEVLEQARQNPIVKPAARRTLFRLLAGALNGQTPKLPIDRRNSLPTNLRDGFNDLPLAPLLHERIINADSLTRELATRLRQLEPLDRRELLTTAAHELPQHQDVLQNAIRCENFIAVLESIFFWLCEKAGDKLDVVAAELPVDIDAVTTALNEFGDSGGYQGVAARRQTLFLTMLDTSSRPALARSILDIHEQVSQRRGRALWVWEETGDLRADIQVGLPSDHLFHPGVAWRNDYLLSPLRQIAVDLATARA